jgi:hypothetical protein
MVVGDFRHADFRPALGWLHAHVDIQCVASCRLALELLEESSHAPIDWLVFAAARRGRFVPREVEMLHRVAPLARLLYLAGTWCEGETRSGRPLPGVMRVPWHAWQPRALAELLGMGTPRYAGWRLGRAATAVDVALASAASLRSRRDAARDEPTVVIADAREDFLALADAISACGQSATWCRSHQLPQHRDAAAVLWNARSLTAALANELRGVITDEVPPVVLLLDAPRGHEVALAQSAGVSAVCGKPFLLGDLRTHLSVAATAARYRAA